MIADAPAQQGYQALRPYLFAIAYRMTGSASDAEDLVQDAWVRFMDAGMPQVESLRAYLTTIVSRLALDYLKSARVTREQYVGTWMPEPILTSKAIDGPAESAEQREQVSLAMLTLMEALTPEQRVVYVLREGFGSSYDEIAGHVDKTASACRQIFRRARQRLETSRRPRSSPSPEHAVLIARFMDAFARGDAAGVAAVLAEDVTWVADGGPTRLSNRGVIRGIDRVSRGLAGLGRKPRPGMDLSVRFEDINGAPAIVMLDHGRVERVLCFDIDEGRVTGLHVMINPEKLRHLAATLGLEVAWETTLPVPARGNGDSPVTYPSLPPGRPCLSPGKGHRPSNEPGS